MDESHRQTWEGREGRSREASGGREGNEGKVMEGEMRKGNGRGGMGMGDEGRE